MVTASARRAAVDYVRTRYGLSQRKAAKVIGICRGTARYAPGGRGLDEPVAEQRG